MDVKNSIRAVESFRYFYGDPRPISYDWIVSLGNVSEVQTIGKTPVLTKVWSYRCPKPKEVEKLKSEGKKNADSAILYTPSSQAVINMDNVIQSMKTNFALFYLPVVGKVKCYFNIKKNHKHSILLLYNKARKEVERIDMKKYNLNGYRIKFMQKHIEQHILDSFLNLKNKSLIEPETDDAFLSKFSDRRPIYVYPIFITNYIVNRIKYPKKSSKEILSLLTKTSVSDLLVVWKKFVSFYDKTAPKYSLTCKSDEFYNPELSKCKPKKSLIHKDLITERDELCPITQYYDSILKRCRPKTTRRKIKIGIGKASKVEEKDLENVSKINYEVLYEYLTSKYENMCGTMEAIKWYPKDNTTKKNMTNGKQWTLEFPSNFWREVSECRQRSNKRFFYSRIGMTSATIDDQSGKHSNALLIDFKRKEVEIFDPHGQLLIDRYQPEILYKMIRSAFAKSKDPIIANMKIYEPSEYCPLIMFQSKESEEIEKIKQKFGSCSMWTSWYIDARLANPDISRKALIKYALDEIKKSTGGFNVFIRQYAIALKRWVGN
jgi:hypothetical protein